MNFLLPPKSCITACFSPLPNRSTSSPNAEACLRHFSWVPWSLGACLSSLISLGSLGGQGPQGPCSSLGLQHFCLVYTWGIWSSGRWRRGWVRGSGEPQAQVLRPPMVVAELTDTPLVMAERTQALESENLGHLLYTEVHLTSPSFGFFTYKNAYSARILCG